MQKDLLSGIFSLFDSTISEMFRSNVLNTNQDINNMLHGYKCFVCPPRNF